MKSITYIAPHKTALTVAAVVALVSLLTMAPFMLMFSLIPVGMEGQATNMVLPTTMMIMMPLMYFVLSYIMTVVAAWLYNIIAKRTGGITYESSEKP
ncbi:MAG TPA: hypothetical protein DEG76_08720 [Pseudohongiella sp.]|nr:hypothetical protein [Pseudohongiella sp.]HBX37346.1 hypothetical protein [Pseudohongiella sp.]|tara:strand:- start:2497 stop:2787 length:291 start_codon:yes stop_codon:yes gene_type:complete